MSAGEGHVVTVPEAWSFELVFTSEYERTVRTAYLLVGDRDTAVDVAQEAFVQLHLHWRKVERYDAPGAWVRRVAIRLASRHVRRRLAREAAEDRYAKAAAVALDLPTPFGSSSLGAAVLALPSAQRAAVVLHYLEDMAVRDVASMLRCSEATARVHLHRGRQRLGRALGEEYQ